MKFTCTDNVTFNKTQYVPKPWIDYGLDAEISIDEHFYRNIKIYDSDSAGADIIDFLFEDGSCWRLIYSWLFNYDLGWKFVDTKRVFSIEEEECRVKFKTERDWIT